MGLQEFGIFQPKNNMVSASIKLTSMKLTFAQWLKLRRDIVQVTQADIAKALDIRPQTISNWEKGVSPPSLNPEQTQKLCLILDITLDDLVKGFKGQVGIDS